MIFIFVIALFLFGGKKLPELARGLGKGIREFKDASENIKRDINDQINDFEKEIDREKPTEQKAIAESSVTDPVHADTETGNTEVNNSDDPYDSLVNQNDISHSDQYYRQYDYEAPAENSTVPSDNILDDTASSADDTSEALENIGEPNSKTE